MFKTTQWANSKSSPKVVHKIYTLALITVTSLAHIQSFCKSLSIFHPHFSSSVFVSLLHPSVNQEEVPQGSVAGGRRIRSCSGRIRGSEP